jgi:hypothetical protein
MEDIEITSYIAHALMMSQVLEIGQLYRCCQNRFVGLSKNRFESLLLLMNDNAAITVITDTHIYQTTSAMSTPKTIDEIKAIAGVKTLSSIHHPLESLLLI